MILNRARHATNSVVRLFHFPFPQQNSNRLRIGPLGACVEMDKLSCSAGVPRIEKRSCARSEHEISGVELQASSHPCIASLSMPCISVNVTEGKMSLCALRT